MITDMNEGVPTKLGMPFFKIVCVEKIANQGDLIEEKGRCENE